MYNFFKSQRAISSGIMGFPGLAPYLPARIPPEYFPASGRKLYGHIVSKGDTVWYLADVYDSSIDDIIIANHLNVPIYQGQTLTIPTTPSYKHKVKAGETVEQLARQYKVTMGAIIRANHLVVLIYEGQTLLIPGDLSK